MSSNRHAECWDCHNPHEAESGTHTVSSQTTISGVLKGVWGVNPSWGTVPTNSTNNDNSFATVTGYTVVDPITKEYQLCLKCHSSYLTGSHRNIAEEINPGYSSYHGIVSGGTTNTFCNSTTMVSPWGGASNKVVWCSDCHGSDDSGTPPKGPHGSNADNILVATAVSDATNGTPLCDVCHESTIYWDGGSSASSRFSQHPSTKGAHQLPKGCFGCHMYDFSDYTQTGGNSRRIFVHGMNKWYNKRETGTNVTGTGQAADAFVAGYLADVDFVNRECWSEKGPRNSESDTNCGKTHSGQGY